jgi:hypothetical protein
VVVSPKNTTAPTGVKITSYQVGFGDCFLLSFHYAGGDRHVLMDFGTKFRSRTGFKADMLGNAKQIESDCGGKLTMVIATHRHYDHISGFQTATGAKGPGDIIRGLKPDLIVQPWTEDPDLATDATEPTANEAHVQKLSNMQAFAGGIAFSPRNLLAAQSPQPTELDYVGGNNITNKSAVENLMTMGRLAPKYLQLGSTLDLSSLLPGVKVHVLGPPTIKQANAAGQNLLKYASSSSEYWKLQAGIAQGTLLPAGKSGLRGRRRPVPPQARWIARRLRAVREDSLLQIVRILDDTINNTSLILLMEVGNTKLLFPGDAQLENWMVALKDPKNAALLADTSVYKVGHHGSHNATPVSLWNAFSKRKNKTLKTLVSTRPGEYSGVPRSSLATALKTQSQLTSTAEFKVTQRSAEIDV